MAEIKNPEAYFSKMVQNSDKNEYRSNDNYYSYISSVGDANDLQQECAKRHKASECEVDSVERYLSEASVENWLLFMENEKLHTVLSSMPTDDVAFLLELARFRFNQTAFANATATTRQAISKRFLRLRKKISEGMKKGLSKT